MYRVLIIIALLNFVEPHQWCNNHPTVCHRHHHEYGRHHDRRNDRFFHHLADDLIELDNKVKTFCTQNPETRYREVYEPDVYKYIISLPNYNESKIEVKIKHRVLYIKAENNDTNKYVNVKILTELLNTSAAKWCYSNEELTVAVPYKIAVTTESQTNCGDEISTNVIDVPKYEYDPNEAPQIDIRFSNPPNYQNVSENIV